MLVTPDIYQIEPRISYRIGHAPSPHYLHSQLEYNVTELNSMPLYLVVTHYFIRHIKKTRNRLHMRTFILFLIYGYFQIVGEEIG